MLKAVDLTKLFTLLLILSLTLFAKTPVEINGQLHVDPATGQLKNQNNYPIQLRGMSSHGLQWHGGFINPASLYALQSNWGADVIRLSMYMQEGGYEEDPAYWRSEVDKKINEVTEAGMYVIIDFHQLYPGDPWYNIDNAVEYFTHMAATHAGKNNVFYEICNEPNSYTVDENGEHVKLTDKWGNPYEVDWPLIKSYADSIIPIIRRYDQDNIIIVGTPQWDQRINDVIGNEVDDANTMYSVHFYAEAHKTTQRDYLCEAIDAKLPIFITESGTQEASGDGVNDWVSSKIWYDLLDEHKISWVNWNFSPDSLTGAAFKALDFETYHDWFEFNDTAYYMDDTNLKEAGLWIKERMKTEDDFGQEIDPDKPFNVIVTNGSGGAKFKKDDQVTIVADQAPEGLIFDKWVGDLDKVTGTFDSVATFTMVSKELQFTAFYKDPNAEIDTASLSKNFVLLARWIPNLDENGSSLSVDSSKTASDTITTFTLERADGSYIWAQARGMIDGKYDAVNVIKIRYSSDNACQIVLDDPNLDDAGASHVYDLPATGGQFSTLYIKVEDFHQPNWTPAHLVGAPKMENVISISIAAMETGTTGFQLNELRLNRFEHVQEAVLTAVQKKQQFNMRISNQRLILDNVVDNSLQVQLYTLQGKLLMSEFVEKSGVTAAVQIPASLARGTYVLSVRGATSQIQKLIQY